ncbi:MAG: putative transport system, permease protein [Bradyrhizobium sp.]|nr:putative transport system, permease protein [Bradyrhizobium sp.]
MIGAAIVVLLLCALGFGAITNPAFGWPTFAEYFFSKPILDGVVMTLILTAISMVVAVLLGTILAIMRMSSNPVLQASSVAYSWFFRGIPVLVQLIFWFNLALLFPRIALGVPGNAPWFSIQTNSIISPFVAAILGLGLSMAAYMAEVVRGGILSVGSGQIEAARSLGMTRGQGLRRVILPQAMRVVLPPMGNELIGLLKWTSLASVIAVSELMQQSSLIYSRNFQVIPLLLVAAFWYLLITTVFSFGQRFLENHFGKGDKR